MQLTPCAQIAKTYGKEGELLLRVESDRFSQLLEEYESQGNEFEEPVFVYFDGLPVPFFISSLRHRSNNAWIVTFSTIRDNAHAEEIVGRYLHMESVQEDDFKNLDLIVGYTVVTEDGKKAGVVSRVLEYPGNICLELEGAGILLPFHQDLILSFNPEGKIISMKIPKGLL